MNKKFRLYQQVVLSQALPGHNLEKGDAATIVEIIEKENKTGYVLEIFEVNGETLKVIVVPESDISAVKPHSVVNYRELRGN